MRNLKPLKPLNWEFLELSLSVCTMNVNSILQGMWFDVRGVELTYPTITLTGSRT